MWAAIAAGALAEARVRDRELTELRARRDELEEQGASRPFDEVATILAELVEVERRIHELGG